MSSTEAPGIACLSTAHAPETWGVASEVPLLSANSGNVSTNISSIHDVRMLTPGAKNVMKGAASVQNVSMVPLLNVDPTLMVDEIQAGYAMASRRESLPVATTVAMPNERRLSMTGLSGLSSQFEVYWPPPRLMLTAAKL